MRIGIIGAMAPEVESLRNSLTNCRSTTLGKSIFYEGTLGGHEVVLSESGIGKVAAAAVTAIMITRFNVSCVINTGSAGAIGEGLKIGDTVISDQVAHHDVDLTIFGYAQGQMAAHERYFKADPHLIAVARKACPDPEKTHVGTVVSGDCFVSDPARKLWIRNTFDHVQVVEMEAAAIAQICTDFATPFLIIRAVSDGAEEGKAMTFEEFLPLAAAASAKLVTAIVAAL